MAIPIRSSKHSSGKARPASVRTSRQASAARTARSGSSSCASGTPKTAATVPPTSDSTAPPKRSNSDRTRAENGARNGPCFLRVERRPAEAGETGEESGHDLALLARRALRRRARRRLERRILVEDAPLELAQRGARLEAQLLHQHAPTLPKGFERVGLSAGAVEREHQLAAQPFTERLLDEESLDLSDELGVAAEREVGADAVLEGGEPQLLEAPALCGGEFVVGEVDERRASPQRERLAEKAGGVGGVVCPGGRREERLEAARVDLGGTDLQLVSRRPGQQSVTSEQLAETRDVELYHRRGGRWRPLAPERIDQLVGRDHLVWPQEQHRQQGALLAAAERDRPAALDGFERPQEQELHHQQGIVPHSRV